MSADPGIAQDSMYVIILLMFLLSVNNAFRLVLGKKHLFFKRLIRLFLL